MSWRELSKKSTGPGATYGPKWLTVPAVAITKSGLTFNEAFSNAFVNGRASLMVFVDTENRRMGFKVPGEQDQGRKLQDSKQKKTSKSRFMSLKEVARLFPDCVGRAYRAHMNPGERIIEVELSPKECIS